MIVEAGRDWILRAKTAGRRSEPQVGWWVDGLSAAACVFCVEHRHAQWCYGPAEARGDCAEGAESIGAAGGSGMARSKRLSLRATRVAGDLELCAHTLPGFNRKTEVIEAWENGTLSTNIGLRIRARQSAAAT
jgi:hypothetical protein